MIKKIKSIDNFAVFNDFRWDSSVVDKNGQVLSFDKLNILYGRNYSGKTTLSRILRALETHSIPGKYDNPQFEVVLSDGSTINQTSISTRNVDVRVFNEDFVRANLRFLSDPNSEIAPFAILGANNAEIEREIGQLEAKLGSDEVDKRAVYTCSLQRHDTKIEFLKLNMPQQHEIWKQNFLVKQQIPREGLSTILHYSAIRYKITILEICVTI